MPEGAFGNTEKSFCGAGTRPFYSTGKASGFMLPDERNESFFVCRGK